MSLQRLVLALVFIGIVSSASAQQEPRLYQHPTYTYALTHDFGRSDPAGGWPVGAVAIGPDGALYGTTSKVRTNFIRSTIYRLNRDGRTSVLHRFVRATGLQPIGGLVRGEDGAYYGTTRHGGPFARGVIYRIDAAGTYSVIYAFRPSGDPIGREPVNILAPAPGGGVYGSTSEGGKGRGSLYFVAPDGTVGRILSYPRDLSGPTASGGTPCVAPDGTLYQAGSSAIFRISPDGSFTPVAALDYERTGINTNGLLCAADGAIYTVARHGGPQRDVLLGGGTVLRIDPKVGEVKVLHAFGASYRGGFQPYRRPTLGSDGLLYGSTVSGGWGSGTVWRVAPDGTGFRRLHMFASASSPPGDANNSGDVDGSPDQGTPLVETPEGELAGVTRRGGVEEFGAAFALTRPR